MEADFLTVKITTGRGLKLKFDIGEAGFGYPSRQVHVGDLNHFTAPRTVTGVGQSTVTSFPFVLIQYGIVDGK